jgi:septal ring factor EnvC (AmiA/AmiB activator)
MMAIMLAKTYAALKSAGASEEEAQAAAEELADYENRLASIDHRLGRVESELTALRSEIKSRFAILTGAVGINAAATVTILGALLRGIK